MAGVISFVNPLIGAFAISWTMGVMLMLQGIASMHTVNKEAKSIFRSQLPKKTAEYDKDNRPAIPSKRA